MADDAPTYHPEQGCPGCGAPLDRQDCEWLIWECGAMTNEFDPSDHAPSPECYERQLAQRDDEIKRLREALEEIRHTVKAVGLTTADRLTRIVLAGSVAAQEPDDGNNAPCNH